MYFKNVGKCETYTILHSTEKKEKKKKQRVFYVFRQVWLGDAPVMCGMRQADYGQVPVQRIGSGLARGLRTLLRVPESLARQVLFEGGETFLQKRFLQVSQIFYFFLIYSRNIRSVIAIKKPICYFILFFLNRCYLKSLFVV